jgi:DNA-binding response OmpR family regulator
MKILIVEDYETLAKLIKRGLSSEGIVSDYVTDGEAGLQRIELNYKDYDLILMDMMLPKLNGIEVCEKIRKKGINTPVIMLTARDSETDIVTGLNAGADDYVIKPFSFDVLIARIKAVLRRPEENLPTVLKAGDVVLDAGKREVLKNGEGVILTLKEFGLLEYLMRNKNFVLNREQILSNIWDFNFDSFSNVVDVHINNLRKKLNDDGRFLKTVRGIGYVIND